MVKGEVVPDEATLLASLDKATAAALSELPQEDRLAVLARLAARDVEYTQYVAVQRIYHGGALAYTAGRPVPASNVKRHGYDKQGLVKRVDVVKESNNAK